MNKQDSDFVNNARQAALEVLLHNNHGPFRGLPRTAGWGYPEPYTRDLLIGTLGVLASGNEKLIESLRRVLVTLAKNQTELGHIPSLVHDKEDRGASDTTPLFLLALGIFRRAMNEGDFLEEAAQKSLKWMEYQSPANRYLVAQLPTSDWRDEQWVLGYALYVNTLVYTYLRLFGQIKRSEILKEEMGRLAVRGDRQNKHIHEGLALKYKPYYALYSYKVYRSERFDLLGNSLTILSGIASQTKSEHLVTWIEDECSAMRQSEDLAVDLPPNFFPYIKPDEPDWMPRYEKYNKPGEYHNGGVWPFICGFYIAALTVAQKHKLAEKKLIELTKLIKQSRQSNLQFGFNEWHRAQDGTPQGQDWQSWLASMYLYAAACVEQQCPLFFEWIR